MFGHYTKYFSEAKLRRRRKRRRRRGWGEEVEEEREGGGVGEGKGEREREKKSLDYLRSHEIFLESNSFYKMLTGEPFFFYAFE